MKNLTRNGVAKDLSTSPYVFTEFIYGFPLDLHFSSKLHLTNFMKKREENYRMLYNHLYKRFKFKVDCRMLADCNLYHKIETRGFYIKFNNKVYVCPGSIVLNGDLKMKENCVEQQETLTIKLGGF